MEECDTQRFLWLKSLYTYSQMIKGVIIQEQQEKILKIKLQIYILSQTSHCLLGVWETRKQSSELITSLNCSQDRQMKSCCKFKSYFSWVVGDCRSCEFMSLALSGKKRHTVHLSIEDFCWQVKEAALKKKMIHYIISSPFLIALWFVKKIIHCL